MTNPEWDDIQKLYKMALRDAYHVLATSKDPLWLAADAATRKEFVRVVADNSMVKMGYVPSTWTYQGRCKNCGDVPLEGPSETELVGCPWCSNGGAPTVYCFV